MEHIDKRGSQGDGTLPEPHPTQVPDEAIAIVGMAMRLPGGIDSPAALWRALEEGRDLVSVIPPDRWATDSLQHPQRGEPGRSITFAAGVLDWDHREFDAAFFGISPREAATLDPQQRVMLELAWEALEQAGERPSRLAGSRCGVYIGLSSLDNGMRGLDDLANMTAHAMTGNTLSIVANRLSYLLDLHGPSLALDTACSSSLVALHQACLALRGGEASCALVGGVNLLLHPYSFIGFTKASMLSASGRCRAFDAAGDGYVRAEGGVMLYLKPARQAMADGDPIAALLLASGCNTDGARKSGITIPSAAAQEELMRGVLQHSGLAAGDIDFVEMHGTGTPVGDPVEAQAVGRVYGQPRGAEPLPIGSVKTNLGHLEPASGLAGLAKAVLALQHRRLPASLHFQQPNPHIDFPALNLRVADTTQSLRGRDGRPLRAAVNSFGFGGANAHVLLQEPPQSASRRDDDSTMTLPPLLISARSEQALRALAARYAEALGACPTTAAARALLQAAARRRDRLPHRLALADSDHASLACRLAAFAAGGDDAALARDEIHEDASSIAFVYSGNGAQWSGMGRRLLEESPAAAALFDELDAALRVHTGLDLRAALFAEGDESRLDDTAVAQPLLFALQVLLTRLLAAQGLRPDLVLGHSVGEVAAAWAAGELALDDAMALVHRRSAAQALTRGSGRMAAVAASRETITPWLADAGAQGIEIAAINGPQALTLSGPADALRELGEALGARSIAVLPLDLDYAFHSTAMAPIADQLAASLATWRPQPAAARVPMISTVTALPIDAELRDATYWWRNVREPVRFAEAVQRALQRGVRCFIEIGPQPVLLRHLASTADALGQRVRCWGVLRRGAEGAAAVQSAALRGLLQRAADDPSLPFARRPPMVPLPRYPWQRERHWQPSSGEAHGLIDRRRVHPLLGWRLSETGWGWENTLDVQQPAWLADHRVGGASVLPGSAMLETALAAAVELHGSECVAVEDFDIHAPVVFEAQQSRVLRLLVDADDGRFRLLGRRRLGHEAWTLHASGRLLALPADAVLPAALPQPAASAALLDGGRLRALSAQLGVQYGPAFSGLQSLRHDGVAMALQLQPGAAGDSTGYRVHPALLDATLQGVLGFFADGIDAGEVADALLPVGVARLRLVGRGVPAQARLQLRRRSPRSVLLDMEVCDADGRLLLRADGCLSRAAPLRREGGAGAAFAWQRQWAPLALAAPDAPLALAGIIGKALDDGLRSTGAAREAWYREQLPLRELATLAVLHEALAQAPPVAEGAGSPLRRWARARVDGFLAAGAGALPSAASLLASLAEEAPQSMPQLALLGWLRQQLPVVLDDDDAQRSAAAQLRGLPCWQTWSDDDPATAPLREALQHTLPPLLRAWPRHRPLRVLELLSAAAPLVVPADARIQRLLLVADAGQRERLRRDHPDIRCDVWDGQGPLPAEADARFELVLLHRGLHAVDDASALLATLRARLASGGALLVLEQHPDWLRDALAGLDAAWWRDPLAAIPQSPLRAPGHWQALLAAAGFAVEAPVLDAVAAELGLGGYLLLAGTDRAAAPASAAEQQWCILADAQSSGIAEALADCLRRMGQQVDAAIDAVAPDHVVYLRDLAPAVDALPAALARLQALAGELQALQPRPPRLHVLCAGGHPLGGAVDAALPAVLSGGARWGWVRTLMNEAPTLRARLLAIDSASPTAEQVDALAAALLDGRAEELLLSAEGMVQPRLAALPPACRSSEDAPRWELDALQPGALRCLGWREAVAPAVLPPDAVEVATRAAGVNFRDLMLCLGALPEEAALGGLAGSRPGLEMAGVVTRVGDQVRGLAVGAAVFGLAPDSFASHVVTAAKALRPLPPGWQFEDAAAAPCAFLTAHYALRRLADLQAGETVLLHGAAGGVGLAALQLARAAGARVIASAGSADKRALLRLLGAEVVVDSRRIDFADAVRAATAGLGVDVVLNSLSGEAMRRSVGLLRPFGRFIELGKRDFLDNSTLGLRALKDNLSYFAVDVDRLFVERPALADALLGELAEAFAAGQLRPLPRRSLPPSRLHESLRAMQQARHVGKLVLATVDPPAPLRARTPPRFRTRGTWLLSGGLTGFGLASARWLAASGANGLLLLGRRGLATPDSAEAVQALRAAGVSVEARACDVADGAALDAVLAEALPLLPPLEGVLHAAMHIDDGLLHDLDVTRITDVLRPKLLGAVQLHRASLALAPRQFVLYSSVTTALGSPGQGSYVAANAALEALAHWRRAQGLPAQAIAWGPIADAGFLARHAELRETTERRMGRAPLGTDVALARLGELLAAPGMPAVCVVADFDWTSLSRLLPSAGHDRFAALVDAAGEGAADAAGDLRDRLRLGSEDDAARLLLGAVAEQAARILGIAAGKLPVERPLQELGLDSLMAMELAMALEQRLGVPMPVMALHDSPTVARIAARLLPLVRVDGVAGSAADIDALVAVLARQHGEQAADDDAAALREAARQQATQGRSLLT